MEEKPNNQKYNESIIADSMTMNNTLIESTYSKDGQNNNNSLISSINTNKKLGKRSSIVEFKEKESTCKQAKSKEDNFFKRKFFGEEWFQRSKYIDIDLVQDHISSFKYLWVECQNLEMICNEQLFRHAMSKPDPFESQNVRTIVRNGIPPKYMHIFILRLFNITKNQETLMNNYIRILNLVLKGYKTEDLENYVPFFTGLKSLEDSLPIHFLNNSGILALKEILWMLYQLYPNIEFSPLIIQLLSMILIFCNKYEALEIMSSILCLNINYDQNEIYKIRWHLRFNYNDNIKIITSICECLREVSYISCKELYDHLQAIRFRPERLYEDICFGFFYKYFNFFGMIRFLPFFLHEGVKSIYRLIYAVEKVTKDELILVKNPDKIISRCRELCKSLDNIKDLFEISYNFNITRNNNKYMEQTDLPSNQIKKKNNIQYFLPDFDNNNNKSKILDDYHIIHLWEKLPKDFKTKKVTVIYSYKENGNISDIVNIFNNEKENIKFIFVIKTTMNEIFGFSLFGKINYTNGKFLQNNKGFLFSIEPEINLYNINNDCSDILFVDNDNILFGKDLGEKIALKISGDLSSGETHEGECCNNPCLINKDDGKFQIQNIEIIKLIS